MSQVEQNINYNKELEKILLQFQKENKRPSILVHSCCAPCSTYVLEKLAEFADVTVCFYNPNIHPKIEYLRRKEAQQAFIEAFNERYVPSEFFKATKGYELEKEGTGERCALCYELRIDEVAKRANKEHFDFFASALTLSPKKNSKKINEIGFRLAEQFEHTTYLPSDFKKQNGYKRSIEMCKEYDVYRQCYCGCVFAAKDQGIDFREIIKNAKEAQKNQR